MSAAHCVLCVVLCGLLRIVCCVLRSGWRAACGVVCEALRVVVLLYFEFHVECCALRGVCVVCCVLRAACCVLLLVVYRVFQDLRDELCCVLCVAHVFYALVL